MRLNVATSDDLLIQQFINGDRGAFTQLVQRHKQVIFHFILSHVKDAEMAADLTQDVFVKLFKSACHYQPGGKFRSWLFRMAQNICIDAYRRRPKAKIFSLEMGAEAGSTEANPALALDQLEDPAANPVKQIEWQETQEVIEAALATLAESQRVAFTLCQFQGLSYAEIAEIQQCPVGTVKSRIHTALTRIRDYLKAHDLL